MRLSTSTMQNQTARNQITVGADPEFVFIFRNNGEPASAINLLGQSEIVIGNNPTSILGWDGHSTTGELRPGYSNSPDQVVNNIHALFNQLPVRISQFSNRYQIFAGSGVLGNATGGHIHIGGYQPTLGTEGRASISQLLDTFLLPVALAISEPEPVLARLRLGYGSWNEYRSQNWGVEYRSLPSWLYHPMTAMFFLGTAHKLATELVAHSVDYDTLVSFGSSPHHMITPRITGQQVATILKSLRKRASLSLDILETLPNGDDSNWLNSIQFVRNMISDGLSWDKTDIFPNWTDTPLVVSLRPIRAVIHTAYQVDSVYLIQEYMTPESLSTAPSYVLPEVVTDDITPAEDDENNYCSACGTEHDIDESCPVVDWYCEGCRDYHLLDESCPRHVDAQANTDEVLP